MYRSAGYKQLIKAGNLSMNEPHRYSQCAVLTTLNKLNLELLSSIMQQIVVVCLIFSQFGFLNVFFDCFPDTSIVKNNCEHLN